VYYKYGFALPSRRLRRADILAVSIRSTVVPFFSLCLSPSFMPFVTVVARFSPCFCHLDLGRQSRSSLIIFPFFLSSCQEQKPRVVALLRNQSDGSGEIYACQLRAPPAEEVSVLSDSEQCYLDRNEERISGANDVEEKSFFCIRVFDRLINE